MKRQTFSPRLSASFVADALGLTLKEALRADRFDGITTDSRQIRAGTLFVALAGDNFDGHDFIGAATAAGAKGVICRRGFEPKEPIPANVQVFRVEDTLLAYRRLGAAWRREFVIPLVVVAGSVGKTTTKEILSAILCGKYPNVLKTEGSQNGFVGIPMTLLQIRPEHDAAVVEVGIDDVGAMEKHMQLVKASAGVLTTIGPEHLEKLQDLPTVAREEGISLMQIAQSGGTVAVNLDDPWIRPLAPTLRGGKKVFFTLEKNSPSQRDAEDILLEGELIRNGRALRIQKAGAEIFELDLPMPGRHNAGNLLASVAVAVGLGLSIPEIQAGLRTFQQGAKGRSELRRLQDGTLLVCDYYNANPTSVEAGLELLTQVAEGKTRWACLADMLELGTHEEKMHRDLADRIQALSIEHILLYGPRMKWLEEELKVRGFAGEATHFASHQELFEKLHQGLRAGDAVLIKGSRGMRMEEVLKRLEEARGST